MSADWRIDEALAIHKMLGEHGALWLTEQLGSCAGDGDTLGVKRLRQIADTYRRLFSPVPA